MQKLLDWWERGLITALCVSIALLGIGRLALGFPGGSVSAWSISRTTFFFWIALKLLILLRFGWARSGLSQLGSLSPLFLFLTAVASSLLPDFHQAGDYRYFFFGCVHAVMLVDLFSSAPQRRWLPMLLGVFPLIFVIRGLAHDPLIFSFNLSRRFGYPMDHPNTAGYLLAMSLPLCVAVAIMTPGWLRGLALLSVGSQAFALILTFSRAAWVGLTVSMLFLAVTIKKWLYLGFLGGLLIGCVLVFPSIQDRLASVTRPQKDSSIRDRLQLLTSSLRLGMENPVRGVGYGRGRLKESLRPRLQGTVLESSPIWHTHNVYVELFVETGIFGLVTFLWLMGMTLLRVSRTARRSDGAEEILGFAIAASWIAAMVAGLGDVPFYHHDTRIFFFTLFALAHIYSSQATRVELGISDSQAMCHGSQQGASRA